MQILDVDWSDLELAFRDATGTENFIDKETGEVVAIFAGYSDEDALHELIERHPERFVKIPPIDANHARRVMGEYIDALADGGLKQRLRVARQGAGSLTRCLATLREDKARLEAYYRFEQAAFWRHVESFLAAAGIKPASAAPGVELFEGLSSG